MPAQALTSSLGSSRRYNALVHTERDRQEAARRLAEEGGTAGQPRKAGVGRLRTRSTIRSARSSNALDTLKRHGVFGRA